MPTAVCANQGTPGSSPQWHTGKVRSGWTPIPSSQSLRPMEQCQHYFCQHKQLEETHATRGASHSKSETWIEQRRRTSITQIMDWALILVIPPPPPPIPYSLLVYIDSSTSWAAALIMLYLFLFFCNLLGSMHACVFNMNFMLLIVFFFSQIPSTSLNINNH